MQEIEDLIQQINFLGRLTEAANVFIIIEKKGYILVDGTIRATNAVNATRLALKNCVPFTKCNLEINDEHIDSAENLDIVTPMYN